MARKKKIEHHELIAATEKLLIEKGYNAFNFSLLAQQLGVGRSTLYEYYPNKEELITAYIHSFAFDRVEECKKIIKMNNCGTQMREFLRVFLKNNHVQQIIIMINQMENQNKTFNVEEVNQIRLLSRKIYLMSLEIIQKAKAEGLIRKEIDDTFISYVMFNMIQIPNTEQKSDEERLDQIIDFIFNGVGTK